MEEDVNNNNNPDNRLGTAYQDDQDQSGGESMDEHED
jgi:hypothetical protein